MRTHSHVFLPAAVLASMVALLGAGCEANVSASPGPKTEMAVSSSEAALPSPLHSSSTQDRVMAKTFSFPGILPAAETAGKLVRLQTTKGDIVFELLPEEGPRAASNFVYLTKQNFYDGLVFHRVEPGFVIQGGDPLGQGFGGPGYSFEDDPVRLPYSKGIVAMANAGPNTNGSQFFIMLGDVPLPPSYSIFGRVVQGQDVVDKIAVGDVMSRVTIESK